MPASNYRSPPLEVTIERAYRDKIRTWVALGYRSGLRSTVVYNGEGGYDDRFGDLVDFALTQGKINASDVEEIWNFRTTVLKGKIRDSGSAAFAVVDVAIVIDHSDIGRVATRASILRSMVGEPVIPVLIGAFIGENSLRKLAVELGVSLFRCSLDDAKMYRYFGQDILESLYQGKIEL